MRQIVLDTETTGLDARKGDRVIEIGCIELSERRPTGRRFHHYFNPQRAVDEGARAVHGISDEFLADKPLFHELAVEFVEFIRGAQVIAHNAAFDVGFLDAELARADMGLGSLADHASVVDTLVLARQKYPGQRNSLDALCRRLGVDNTHRQLHGALLDAQLLADVYLAMTAGQGDLSFSVEVENEIGAALRSAEIRATRRLVVLRARDDEMAAHAARLAAIDKASRGNCIWKRLADEAEPMSDLAATA